MVKSNFSSPLTPQMKRRYERDVEQTKKHHQNMQKLLSKLLTKNTKILCIETALDYFPTQPFFSELHPERQRLMNLAQTGTENSLPFSSDSFRYQLGFSRDDERFEVWDASHGQEKPKLSIGEYDALIVTGSKKMPTDFIELPQAVENEWVKRVLQFLHEWNIEKPSLLVCFGHQIDALRRGGVVDWMQDKKGNKIDETGPVEVILKSEGKKHTSFLEGIDESFSIIASHYQHIEKVPAGAIILASNAASSYQILSYGNNSLTIQNHLEFTNAASDILSSWRNLMTEELEVRLLEKDTNKPREIIFPNFIKSIGKQKK